MTDQHYGTHGRRPARGRVSAAATSKASKDAARSAFLQLEKNAAAAEERAPAPLPWVSDSGDHEQLDRTYGVTALCEQCQQRCPGDIAWVASLSGTVLCTKKCVAQRRRAMLLAGARRSTCPRCHKRVDADQPGFVLRDSCLWHERCFERAHNT